MGGTVRVSEDIYEQIKAISQVTGRPISRIVRDALEFYLNMLEERLDIQIAEKRLLEPDAQFVSLEEVKKEYEV